ncbi:PIN-like domain-containing protein [Asanoa iriomotensis]|uniref:Restriction endonuclease n=1 Tax=Asanoa iriomotensis TaxID=234613 RepID=A0ABQ4CF35_9ACTN|nr:PIN-like domain-containing protein [Asanoa iriomotensis]GIF61377.1 hypothetical protein Air01nite_74720 [Asanoa iriomotensis]
MQPEQQAEPAHQMGLADGFRAWWAKDPEPGPFVREGLIVLDANALLHLYRVTPTAREQILATLAEVQERLWIPHQAAVEFHRNREDAVLGRLSQFREVRQVLKDATRKAAAEVRRAVLRLNDLRQANMTDRTWDPNANGLDEGSIVARLDGVMDNALVELSVLEAEHDLGPKDLLTGDPVLKRLDSITTGRIGAPYTHAKHRRLVEEATSYRFPNLIPPGYKDAARKPTAYRAAGDYVLWCQIMDYTAVQARGRMIVLVTNDVKEDWWVLDKNGRAERGRPELRQELFEHSQTPMLQMTLSDFLEAAAEQFPGRVSPDTVNEVREFEISAQAQQAMDDLFSPLEEHEAREDENDETPNLANLTPAQLEHLVKQLLEAMGHTAVVSEPDGDVGFDILTSTVDPVRGTIYNVVEVKRYRSVVGADTVQRIYGVMLHVNAQSAVVITTSWFTNNAKRFAAGKLIRLIDGRELADLIHEHLGLEVTISFRR